MATAISEHVIAGVTAALADLEARLQPRVERLDRAL
jgi:hypothetical protein